MKDLDQPSRASLRKYGVRFGAYHIYVPPLLKPAARALASLLWAQKQDNVDLSALSGAQHLAGSGRTSFPVDKPLPAMPIACSATGNAANARCASIFWSGSPISSVRRCRGAKPRRAKSPPARSTAAALW